MVGIVAEIVILAYSRNSSGNSNSSLLFIVRVVLLAYSSLFGRMISDFYVKRYVKGESQAQAQRGLFWMTSGELILVGYYIFPLFGAFYCDLQRF
jgi:hypothetical protein